MAFMGSKTRRGRTVLEITIAIVVVCLFGASSSSGVRGQTLRQIAKFDLPGPEGKRFDYLTVDDEDHFLLSAHLGPGILYVIDLRSNKVVKAIPGLPGITGLEYVPGTHKVYTSDWGEEKIGIVDLQSMTVTKRLATAAKPNGSTYAAPFHKVYVSDTLGKAVTKLQRSIRQRTWYWENTPWMVANSITAWLWTHNITERFFSAPETEHSRCSP